MPTWDADQYLRFDDARTRPASDLLARIELGRPESVVDVGCGPGNSTELLRDRWPAARVIGLDSSPDMIDRARERVDGSTFVESDLWAWEPAAPVDVVFSNAVLHWLDDHREVFDRLMGWLAPGGTLAVQMPANYDQPSHVIMRQMAGDRGLGEVLRHPVGTPEDYYRRLAGPGRRLDIWTTEYLHVLTGADPVVEWVRGTGLRPVLDRLDDEEGAEFLARYTAAVGRAYPPETDGTTLLPFRRLFIIVRLD